MAKALEVSKEDLGRWIADTAKMPAPVFARAVDILLDETAVSGDDSGPGNGPAPRDCAAGDGIPGPTGDR